MFYQFFSPILDRAFPGGSNQLLKKRQELRDFGADQLILAMSKTSWDTQKTAKGHFFVVDPVTG